MAKSTATIANLAFPSSPNLDSLYFRWAGGSAGGNCGVDHVALKRGDVLSTDTYFNAFFEKRYAAHTQLRSLSYRLHLQGRFSIKLFRRRPARKPQLLASIEQVDHPRPAEVTVSLPALDSGADLGRVFLELTCRADGALLGGQLVTDQPPTTDVRLAIVICTFHKEKQLRQTLRTLLAQDSALATRTFCVVVVDNASSVDLSALADDRLHLIHSRNLGGSGGFAIGLLHALEETDCTHCALMDDDVVVSAETISRLMSIFEHADTDLAVAGSMLDLRHPRTLYLEGLLYGVNGETGKPDPLGLARARRNLRLDAPESLDRLTEDVAIDGSGFGLFALSRQLLERCGLVFPLFVKIDDVELGMRVLSWGNGRVAAMPSIAVWHEPFELQWPSWATYYSTRNMLIANAIYRNFGAWATLARATRRFVHHLMIFDYNGAALVHRALVDYLAGPSQLSERDPEEHHREIGQLARRYPEQKHPSGDQAMAPRAGALGRVLAILTLNGQILPGFDRGGEGHIPDNPPGRALDLRGSSVAVVHNQWRGAILRHIDRPAARHLLKIWLTTSIRARREWPEVALAWRTGMTRLTTAEFWSTMRQGDL